jgi:hypothetical protein
LASRRAPSQCLRECRRSSRLHRCAPSNLQRGQAYDVAPILVARK